MSKASEIIELIEEDDKFEAELMEALKSAEDISEDFMAKAVNVVKKYKAMLKLAKSKNLEAFEKDVANMIKAIKRVKDVVPDIVS